MEYEEIFNKIIDDMKKNLFLTSTLKTSIENKNRQIIAKIKEINKFHNKKNYIGKNETKCGSWFDEKKEELKMWKIWKYQWKNKKV